MTPNVLRVDESLVVPLHAHVTVPQAEKIHRLSLRTRSVASESLRPGHQGWDEISKVGSSRDACIIFKLFRRPTVASALQCQHTSEECLEDVLSNGGILFSFDSDEF